MRLYEVVYIFDAEETEASINEKLEQYHETLAGEDGEISSVDHWGPRQLAYPIDGKRTGYYVVAQVSADPQGLPEFERVLKLDEQLLRYLVVLNEGEPTTGMSILAPRAPTAREEEEDEDEEEDFEEDDDSSPPEFAGGRQAAVSGTWREGGAFFWEGGSSPSLCGGRGSDFSPGVWERWVGRSP